MWYSELLQFIHYWVLGFNSGLYNLGKLTGCGDDKKSANNIFSWFIIRLIQLVFSARTVFFFIKNQPTVFFSRLIISTERSRSRENAHNGCQVKQIKPISNVISIHCPVHLWKSESRCSAFRLLAPKLVLLGVQHEKHKRLVLKTRQEMQAYSTRHCNVWQMGSILFRSHFFKAVRLIIVPENVFIIWLGVRTYQ
jgi:hypothetical protein